ncbi:uncharacterized protein J3R85_016517 [Psidium guajava]|nr:uncharacterized protein J3R85_016517 [Psidium guajava]
MEERINKVTEAPRERKSQKKAQTMSYYNQQPPVGAPPPQGYPPEGYAKEKYPPPGYPPQGYPPQQGYPPPGYPPQPGYPPPPAYAPQYAQPPPPPQQHHSSSPSFMEGCLAALSNPFGLVQCSSFKSSSSFLTSVVVFFPLELGPSRVNLRISIAC